MTPYMRAEKIYAACLPWDEQIRLIAAEIQEAVEEALRTELHQHYRAIMTTCYETAAKVCDDICLEGQLQKVLQPGAMSCAFKIRALAAEKGK